MEACQIGQDECAQVHQAAHNSCQMEQNTRLHRYRRRGKRLAAAQKVAQSNSQVYGDENDHFLGDAAYVGKENCKAITESGRIPILTPKKGQSSKGFNAWSNMLKFLKEHPRTYYGILRRRNNVENAFSSLKARFGTIVQTKSLKTQTIDFGHVHLLQHGPLVWKTAVWGMLRTLE